MIRRTCARTGMQMDVRVVAARGRGAALDRLLAAQPHAALARLVSVDECWRVGNAALAVPVQGGVLLVAGRRAGLSHRRGRARHLVAGQPRRVQRQLHRRPPGGLLRLLRSRPAARHLPRGAVAEGGGQEVLHVGQEVPHVRLLQRLLRRRRNYLEIEAGPCRDAGAVRHHEAGGGD